MKPPLIRELTDPDIERPLARALGIERLEGDCCALQIQSGEPSRGGYVGTRDRMVEFTIVGDAAMAIQTADIWSASYSKSICLTTFVATAWSEAGMSSPAHAMTSSRCDGWQNPSSALASGPYYVSVKTKPGSMRRSAFIARSPLSKSWHGSGAPLGPAPIAGAGGLRLRRVLTNGRPPILQHLAADSRCALLEGTHFGVGVGGAGTRMKWKTTAPSTPVASSGCGSRSGDESDLDQTRSLISWRIRQFRPDDRSAPASAKGPPSDPYRGRLSTRCAPCHPATGTAGFPARVFSMTYPTPEFWG
jgi:hypothetical protein